MKWRRYRTVQGFWGLGFTHQGDDHWSVQIGRWVYTSEPAPEPVKCRICGKDKQDCPDMECLSKG